MSVAEWSVAAKFARPVFVRVNPDVAVSHTFKYVKAGLVKQGIEASPDDANELLFVRSEEKRSYVELTPQMRNAINNGTFRI